jgi:hypothetical protein
MTRERRGAGARQTRAKGNPPLPSKLMNDMDRNIFFTRLRSEDGQVWNYILTAVIIVLVIGAIITQFGPIISNYISIHGTADDAVDEAIITYQNSKGNMKRVNEVVRNLLSDDDARLVGVINVTKGINGEPDTIGISVRKIVNTYLFENVGYLCKYTEAAAYSERPIP